MRTEAAADHAARKPSKYMNYQQRDQIKHAYTATYIVCGSEQGCVSHQQLHTSRIVAVNRLEHRADAFG
jgi:hypothetical protein